MRYRRPEGGIGTTSAEQAHSYVEEGRAIWDADGLLVFLALDRRCIAAARSASRQHFVNGDGFASIEAIAGLPCIQPQKLLFGRRPSEPPLDYPDPVVISRRRL